jgi:hypothetical protein
MFGVIKGRKFHLNCVERRDWMSHVCGLCLTLRARHGQVARLTTNYDAALLSVLYEALVPQAVRTVTHYCPLRLGWRGEVIALNPGTEFAASIALMSASVKVSDHLLDGDARLGVFRGLFRRIGEGWYRAARCTASALGFNLAMIAGQADRQLAVEAEHGREFLHYSRPTEEAVGSACGQVGVLAGSPERVGILQRIGQLFGRIIYLIDAYRDYAADLAERKFNPLAECFAPSDVRRRSWALFREAHGEIQERFDELALPHADLARRLLIDQLAEVGRETLGGNNSTDPEAPANQHEHDAQASAADDQPTEHEDKRRKRRRRRRQPDGSGPSNSAACCGAGDPDYSDILCCYWLSGGFDCCDAINCGAAGADCCATGETADCCAAGAGGADCCAGADCAGGGTDCCAGVACG